MSILTCSLFGHQLDFLILAVLVCASGAFVTVALYCRCQSIDGTARIGWLILTAICAGATSWTTHFVAMLGYRRDLAATFDPLITVLSILVAIFGTGLGFGIASHRQSVIGRGLAGALVGLSIAAMHYLSMLAHRVDGITHWNGVMIGGSIAIAAASSAAMLAHLPRDKGRSRRFGTMALFSVSILSLHMVGMSALTINPLDASLVPRPDTVQGLALAVTVLALLIIGAGLSTCFIDMERRLESSRAWLDMAFHDPLTGLPNRRAFHEKVDAAFAARTWFKLLLIDLDHFKSVNDTFGHGVGDKLLCEVGRRMVDLIGPEACGYRLGGDELAVLIFRNRETAMQTALELVHTLQQPIEIAGQSIVTGCSIGLSAFEQADDVETLMRNADTALYEAKRRGRGQVFRYAPGLLETAALRSQLESDLHAAIDKGELRLVFQPILDLNALQVRGYEALLRWAHPTRGEIPPCTFIPPWPRKAG